MLRKIIIEVNNNQASYDTIKEANNRLRDISLIALPQGKQHDVKVTLVWEDGVTLNSRHAVRHNDIDRDILSHARNWLITLLNMGEEGHALTDEERISAMELLKRINILSIQESYRHISEAPRQDAANSPAHI